MRGRLSTIPFPAPSDEERARRLAVEVERLARLPEVERRLYLATENYAARFGVDNDEVGRMVAAVVKTAEKKAREDKADERYEQRRTEQKQERENKRARQDEARDRKEAERARRE